MTGAGLPSSMVRFVLYVSLVLIGSYALWLQFSWRRVSSPRMLGFAPPLALTVCWGLLMLVRVVMFWLAGGWGEEPPVSPQLAMVANGVILSWTITATILLLDRVKNG